MLRYKSKETYRLQLTQNIMSTAKKIIENLENQIEVPNAFGSQELDELHNSIEHEPKTVEHIDVNGHTTERPMTAEEEDQFSYNFMQELEADHADEIDEDNDY